MFQIGASLREARSRRGLTSADVQKAIRIRERYLTALEEEKWELLPGEAYTKGFLRTYAEFLGLDGNLYIDEFNSRFAHTDSAMVPESLAPTHRVRIDFLRPTVAIVGVVAVIVAVAAWKLDTSGSPKAKTPAVTASDAAAATKTKTKTPATSHQAHPPTTHQAKPGVTAPAVHSFAVFSASRGACWLQVRAGSARGQVVYEQTLAQGATVRLPVGDKLWVRMGAPWNLDVKVAGRAVSGLPTQTGTVVLSPAGLAAAA